MSSLPRPLIAVLLVTVLAFVLWTVALKHTLMGSGGSGASSPGAYQAAISKARGLQNVVNSAAASAGGTAAPASGGTPTTAGTSSSTAPSAAAAPRHTGASATTQSKASTTTAAHGHGPAASPAHTPATRAGSHPSSGTSTIAAAASSSQQLPAVAPAPHHTPRLTGVPLVTRALHEHKVVALLFYNSASSDDRAVQSEMSLIPTQGGKLVKLAVPLEQLSSYASLVNEVPVNFSPTLVLINRHGQADEIAGFADSFEIAQRVAQDLGSASAKP